MQVAILVDDMIDTGHTLSLAALTLKEKGASRIHALVSHGTSRRFLYHLYVLLTADCIGLLSEARMSLIEDLPIEQLVVCSSQVS